ncbi:hypothetical protein [Bradyrhizobium sp. Rc2d]|uniref:hypothetical protein n=1 Tax=Bradyrhizobium sp. Rc2d TaxID=1855321 RepID=UPI001FCD73DE|nr:hypothetical protein [Bradyrhizobium sp. Rc2d]
MIDQAAASDLPPVLHRSPKRVSWVFALVTVFVGLCAAAAYFWTNIEKLADTSAVREVARFSPEDRAVLSEIQSGQQKANDEIAELNRNIGAQQADLKRNSDEVAALTSKIDSPAFFLRLSL